MINLNKKLSNISVYLQTLTKPEFSVKVEKAVQENDKKSLVSVCKQAKIPGIYITSIVSVIMSVSPMKWPEET